MNRFTIGIFFISIGLAISSCTPHFVLRDLREEAGTLRAARRTLALPPPYRDFAGAVHVHTELSHDSRGTLDEIVAATRQAKSAFVITTDHHGLKVYERGFRGWVSGVLVVRGSEIIKGCSGSTGAGCNSLLALGLSDYLDDDGLSMDEVVRKVKELGGLAFAAHPGGFANWDAPIDGMEIYDILDDAVDRRWKYPKWLFDILYSYRRYRDEVFLSILDPPTRALKKFDRLAQGRRLSAIAGNDAHQNARYLGHQLDPYDLTLRFVRTHVIAPSLDERQLLAALGAGHAYIAFDILADATGFAFWVQDGASAAIMGDEIEERPGLRLRIQAPVAGRIRLLRDGSPLRQEEAEELVLPVSGPGVYRVEIALALQGRWWPWIYSNPIYVRERA